MNEIYLRHLLGFLHSLSIQSVIDKLMRFHLRAWIPITYCQIIKKIEIYLSHLLRLLYSQLNKGNELNLQNCRPYSASKDEQLDLKILK